jgi:hypothetical protein
MSILYEVTAVVRADLAESYERYLIEEHIPALLATGYFTGAAVARYEPGRFRISYEAPTQGDLDAYMANDGPRLRADGQKHFPLGVSLSREVWELRQRWNAER